MSIYNIAYEISGPAFWGLINPEWSLCNKGRRQSPVNLEPQRLLFDPNLRPLHIDKHRVSKCAHLHVLSIGMSHFCSAHLKVTHIINDINMLHSR